MSRSSSPRDMAIRAFEAPKPIITTDRLAVARDVFRSVWHQLDDPAAEAPTDESLCQQLTEALGHSEGHVETLLMVVGIGAPLRETLTEERVSRFIATARSLRAPTERERNSRRTVREMAAARQAFTSGGPFRRLKQHSSVVRNLTIEKLLPRLSRTLSLPQSVVAELLKDAGIARSLPGCLTDEDVDRFIAAAYLVPNPQSPQVSAPDESVPRPADLRRANEVVETAYRALNRTDIADPTLSQLTRTLTAVLGCDPERTAGLLDQVGITAPLRISLTPARIKQLRIACRRDPVLAPVPRKRTRPATAGQLREARSVLESAYEELSRTEHLAPTVAELAPRLANALTYKLAHVHELLDRARLYDPLSQSLDRAGIERFLAATTESPAHYAPPAPVGDRTRSAARKPAPLAVSTPPRPETTKQQVERLRRKREERLREKLKFAAARDLGTTATSRTAPHQRVELPIEACRRLVHGNASGVPARLTADLYLAVTELTAYGATADEWDAGRIAAERFGIHADADTAAHVHARAKRAFSRETGGEALDHLSRLARRPRGLFYDGHLDRLTLWETEDDTMALYTCGVSRLRTAAATALELGDLALPRMTKRVVTDRTFPDRADDPALILAMVAEQLGRQAEAARCHAESRPDRDAEDAHLPPQVLDLGRSLTRSTPGNPSRPGVTWVVPVAGAHEDLEVGRMDASYTRHVPGPRSRAATTVREHMRRPSGSSPYDRPTIKVRSHPRRGT